MKTLREIKYCPDGKMGYFHKWKKGKAIIEWVGVLNLFHLIIFRLLWGQKK